MSTRKHRHLLLLGCLPALITCSTGTEPTPVPQPTPVAITLSGPDSVLARDQVVPFTAALLDSAGAPIPGATFAWSSQYSAIASVSGDGRATGVDVGDTRISVSSRGLTAAVVVQVRDTVIAARLAIPGAPFGLAVREGQALVSLLDVDSVVSVALPGLTRGAEISAGHYPTGIVFNSAGTHAFVASQGAQITVVDPATMTVVQTGIVPAALMGIFASGADRLWVSAGDLNTTYAIDPVTLAIRDSSVPTSGSPTWIAKDPTRPRLYVNGSWTGKVVELDSETLDVLRTWDLNGGPQGMVVSADGANLYVANESGWLDRISLADGSVAPRVPLSAGGFGITLSPDGSRLGITLNPGGEVVVVSTSTMAIVHHFYGAGTARRLAFTADGTHLVVANESGWVDYIR